MNIQPYIEYLATTGLFIGLKLLGAIFAFFIGRWLIGFAVRVSRKALEVPIPEPTLNRYIGTLLSVLLHIGLFISILGFFGFETTTFAALLAGVGLAIGTAWGGLLANFAAGIFLVALRPFKVGDSITISGVSGTVQEIGIFITKIHAADNTVIYVGNNKIFSDNIHNHTANEYRRIDARITLMPEKNPVEMINKIREKLATIPGILQNPLPQVGILEVTREGTTIAVRPSAENKNYQQVLFDTNQMLFELLEENKKEMQ
jgi:small conductance mechanosensitive channel